MHPMFFGIKRWHLQIVETTKKLLQPDSLTPARFDLMRAIAARDGEMTQRSLQWLFGVSAVTISRMCKGLEEKGFVRRERLGSDRRCTNVIITASGYKAFRRDLAYCVKSRIGEYLAAALVTENKYANIDSRTVRRRVERATSHLVRGRRTLRDRSSVRHAWSRRDFATLGVIAFRHEMSNRPLRRRRPPRDKSAPLPWEVAPKPRPTLARPRIALGERRATFARGEPAVNTAHPDIHIPHPDIHIPHPDIDIPHPDTAQPALAKTRRRKRPIDTAASLVSTEDLISRLRAESIALEAADKAEIAELRERALLRR